MDSNQDFYGVLGLEHGAEIDQVNKSYRKIAAKFHPDKNLGVSDAVKEENEKRLRAVQRAKEFLSDVAQKQKYDDTFRQASEDAERRQAQTRQREARFSAMRAEELRAERQRAHRRAEQQEKRARVVEPVASPDRTLRVTSANGDALDPDVVRARFGMFGPVECVVREGQACCVVFSSASACKFAVKCCPKDYYSVEWKEPVNVSEVGSGITSVALAERIRAALAVH